MIVSCVTCNTQFNKPACWVKRTNKQFCSKICYDTEQRNYKLTKYCKFCKMPFLVRESEQHKFSTCNKEICRMTNKRKENNAGWKGGVTKDRKCFMSTSLYKRWRKQVLIRDDYTCVICNKRGGNLNVDHILPYAFFHDLRTDIDNGRTLCVECHKTTYKLATLYRDDKMPIVVKDLLSGAVSKYDNIKSCAKYFKVTEKQIIKYLYKSCHNKLCMKRYLFAYQGRDWPAINVEKYGFYKNDFPKYIVAINKEIGLSMIFDDTYAAAEYFKIKHVNLALHILRYGNMPYMKWVFRYNDDPFFIKNDNVKIVI